MFIELPMTDGIVKIVNIDHIEYGEIDDDAEITLADDSEDCWYIAIHMVKGCHCDSYEYMFKDITKYNAVLKVLFKHLGI